MESRNVEPISRSSSAKQTYEAPKATFVPLKLEERLLSCGKSTASNPDCIESGFRLS
jgi:hypothetical protein